MGKDTHGQADSRQWLNSAYLHIGRGQLEVVKRLASLGRHTASDHDRHARAAEGKAWAQWLRGDRPVGDLQVHKRAVVPWTMHQKVKSLHYDHKILDYIRQQEVKIHAFERNLWTIRCHVMSGC